MNPDRTELLNLLTKDYEIKVNYLMHHFDSMWGRFNYFLAADSALVLVYSQNNYLTFNSIAVFLLGIMISFLWYSFAVQDRYVIEIYRSQIEALFKEIKRNLAIEGDINYAGFTPKGKIEGIKSNLLKWRSKRLSITQGAALLPLGYLVFWVLCIFGFLKA